MLLPKALAVSITLKSDPAWNERGSGVGRREKIVPRGAGKKYQYGSSRSVEIVLSSNAQLQPSWQVHDLANCLAL